MSLDIEEKTNKNSLRWNTFDLTFTSHCFAGTGDGAVPQWTISDLEGFGPGAGREQGLGARRAKPKQRLGSLRRNYPEKVIQLSHLFFFLPFSCPFSHISPFALTSNQHN